MINIFLSKSTSLFLKLIASPFLRPVPYNILINIGRTQLNSEFVARVPQTLEFINTSIRSDGSTKSYTVGNISNDVYNIRGKDYVQLVHREKEGTAFLKDRFLIRDEDYTLEDVMVNDNYSVTQLTISENYIGNISDGDEIIITGIRFGREGR